MKNIIDFSRSVFGYLRKSWQLKQYRARGVIIGEHTFISPKAYIDAHKGSKVVIGKNCFITRNVVILNHSDTKRGGPLNIWKDIGGERIFGDVIIGNNVFIGVNSVVMPGVKIGNDVIIGALSLVTKDIPEGVIVGGIPAKIIGNTLDYVKGKSS
jgi:maltose O-acetyltransferase